MFQEYLDEISKTAKHGDAAERSFYPALKSLLEKFAEERGRHASVTLESKQPQLLKLGIPDFLVRDGKDRPVGYIEAKDVGEDLDKWEDDKQILGYREAFENLVLTNFLEFRLYQRPHGQKGVAPRVATATLSLPATLKFGSLPIQDEKGSTRLLERFFSVSIPSLYTARTLAITLANKAKILRDLIRQEIQEDDIETDTETIYEEIKKTLRPDLDPDGFASMHAQTLAYGLFVARLQSGDEEFNRHTAQKYLSNPLLKKLFYTMAGSIPQSTEWLLDDIASILAQADIERIKKEFKEVRGTNDLIVHFYETFLREFDPKEREMRGVYYTPPPVVDYIVKSVHHLLKEKFGLEKGLLDEKVTLLDPAAGTLTFPAQAIRQVVEEIKKRGLGESLTSSAKKHVLEHFNAFELMMAPFVIGHLRMNLLFNELGNQLKDKEQFKLYLTNTLEMETPKPDLGGPLGRELTEQAQEAEKVKKELPIMVVLGNPPYSGHSANKGPWISEKVRDYYFLDGQPLGEKNPKWLQDDYVKFIRFGQWKIERAGRGILAYITNHGYLDNPTFRGMRASLMKTFNEIYILNLHGNLLKKEHTPEGETDENVFDIQPGVAITLMVRLDKKNENR